MFRDWPPIAFCFLAATLLTVSALSPSYLSDGGNRFLRDFLDNDILSVLGFVTALANASILSIFLHLNYLDDEADFSGTNVRRGLKASAVSLIVLFLLTFAVLVMKPIVPSWPQLSAALNSIGILCVVFSLSVLRDITITVTKIPTKKTILNTQKKNKEAIAKNEDEAPSDEK
jgi:hypothetical protein